MSVLNLPSELQNKRDSIILVSLIPDPPETQHDVNSFLMPLVDDLLKLWNCIDMEIKSVKSIRKYVVHQCDIPAESKICGFLGHNTWPGIQYRNWFNGLF